MPFHFHPLQPHHHGAAAEEFPMHTRLLSVGDGLCGACLLTPRKHRSAQRVGHLLILCRLQSCGDPSRLSKCAACQRHHRASCDGQAQDLMTDPETLVRIDRLSGIGHANRAINPENGALSRLISPESPDRRSSPSPSLNPGVLLAQPR